MGRYFWVEDMVSEVDHFDRSTSKAWHKATGGHQDDSSLLAVFVRGGRRGTQNTVDRKSRHRAAENPQKPA